MVLFTAPTKHSDLGKSEVESGRYPENRFLVHFPVALEPLAVHDSLNNVSTVAESDIATATPSTDSTQIPTPDSVSISP